MNAKWRSVSVFVFQSLMTALIIGAATGLFFLVRSYLHASTISLLYLMPVLACTTLWGLLPGLESGILSFLAFNYFFLQPYYTFSVKKTEDIATLAIFLVVAVITSQLVGRAQRNLATTIERERELERLYNLETALSQANSAQDILQVIAQHAIESFQASFVRVIMYAISDRPGIEAGLPVGISAPSGEPMFKVLLQSPRSVMGELSLWHLGGNMQPSEVRLIKTFAAQGALALERSALVQAETRGRVLEESDRMKSALLSSVSHELRTPLSTIKAAATSLLGGDMDWDSDARYELLEVIDEEADHLNYLVGNLLDMSRIEAGALSLNRQWNDLNEIIRQAAGYLRRSLEAYQLVLEIPEDLPLVWVDYMLIERVFVNLLSNSMKYAPAASTIRVKVEVQESKWIDCSVINQGPGLPEGDLERIFGKFYRSTVAPQVSGTGLGLSICKGLVEAHGGRIWATNLEPGFAFHILLPPGADQPSSGEPIAEDEA